MLQTPLMSVPHNKCPDIALKNKAYIIWSWPLEKLNPRVDLYKDIANTSRWVQRGQPLPLPAHNNPLSEVR